ncbi:hypothetical protein Hanom_Chr02g00166571 [Helianthus anomalus]
MHLALGALLSTSGSNSTGKPKNPLNLSKVTCATWRTSVGHPISIPERSSLSSATVFLLLLLTPKKDFLNKANKSANKDN